MFEVDRLTRKYELVPLSGNDVGVFPCNLVTKMVTGTMLTPSRAVTCQKFAFRSTS